MLKARNPLPHFEVWRVAGEVQDLGVACLQVFIEQMHCRAWSRIGAFLVDQVRLADPVAQDGLPCISAAHHLSPLECTTTTALGSGNQQPILALAGVCLLHRSGPSGNA